VKFQKAKILNNISPREIRKLLEKLEEENQLKTKDITFLL
jgi:flagellar motor switch protein FliG